LKVRCGKLAVENRKYVHNSAGEASGMPIYATYSRNPDKKWFDSGLRAIYNVLRQDTRPLAASLARAVFVPSARAKNEKNERIGKSWKKKAGIGMAEFETKALALAVGPGTPVRAVGA